MSKKWIRILGCMVVVMSLTVVAYAAGTAGSEDDPVVTKSYVDAKIAEISNSGAGSESAEVFMAVCIPKGSSVIGGEGTEMILRSGTAKAIDNGVDGVSDLTGASDLKSGQAVKKNHLLMVPRADGRGIYAVTELWVMIKGEYILEN